MKKLLLFVFVMLTIAAHAQNYRWAHGFGTSNGDSHGTSMATDAQGNVYVAGFLCRYT